MKKTLIFLVTGIFSVLLSGFTGLHTPLPPPFPYSGMLSLPRPMTQALSAGRPRRHSFLTQLEKDWQAQRFFATSA